MLNYQVSTQSDSRDTARTRFVTKNVVFAPKLNRGDFFFITDILDTQHLHSVKISSSNSRWQARYSYMYIWGKKQCSLPQDFLGVIFFLLMAHHSLIMYVVLR